jgi:uncharacterized protein (DUF488 family)
VELLTVGYEGRTLPRFVSLLRENGITRLVDVRERPVSRKPGFSALSLFEALRKAGITYESDRGLGTPPEMREIWKRGDLAEGKARFRKHLRKERRDGLRVLLALASVDRVCIMCYEADPEACHRSVVAQEAARLQPDLAIRDL